MLHKSALVPFMHGNVDNVETVLRGHFVLIGTQAVVIVCVMGAVFLCSYWNRKRVNAASLGRSSDIA